MCVKMCMYTEVKTNCEYGLRKRLVNMIILYGCTCCTNKYCCYGHLSDEHSLRILKYDIYHPHPCFIYFSSHTEEAKTYPCKFCNQTFVTSMQLRRHVETHITVQVMALIVTYCKVILWVFRGMF